MRVRSAIDNTKRLLLRGPALTLGARRRSAVERLWAIRKIRATKGGRCQNCGHVLKGPFCHVCGQRDADFKRPLFAIIAEVLENEFSINNKILQSLLLLVLVPGRLTLSFWRGHRARFMHPFRLYLLTSITFFILMWVASNGWIKSTLFEIDKEQSAEVVAMLEAYAQEGRDGTKSSADLLQEQQDTFSAGEKTIQLLAETGVLSKAEAERALADIKRSKDRVLSEAEVATRPDELSRPEGSEAVPGVLSSGGSITGSLESASDTTSKADSNNAGGQDEGNGAADDAIKISVAGAEDGEIRKIAGNLALVIQDPVKLNNLLSKWVPRAMFFLVPVFAFFLRITHFGGGRYYQQQLVFSLHFHSFLFLLMSILLVAGNILGNFAGFWGFWLCASLYLIVALHIGQRQSWLRAVLKAGPLWCMYFMTMGMVFVFLAYLGLSEL